MDLDFYVRVRTCKKRVTGKQPLVEISNLIVSDIEFCMHIIQAIEFDTCKMRRVKRAL